MDPENVECFNQCLETASNVEALKIMCLGASEVNINEGIVKGNQLLKDDNNKQLIMNLWNSLN